MKYCFEFNEEQIKELDEMERYSQEANEWIRYPLKAMKLSLEDEEFVIAEDLYVCTSYFGMIRVHTKRSEGANTPCIWQTSCGSVLLGAIFDEKKSRMIDFEGLRKQFQYFITKLRSLSVEEREKVYKSGVDLFSN